MLLVMPSNKILVQSTSLKSINKDYNVVKILQEYIPLVGHLTSSHFTGTPSPHSLESLAAEMAAALELDIPPINAPATLDRFVLDLAMPQASISHYPIVGTCILTPLCALTPCSF